MENQDYSKIFETMAGCTGELSVDQLNCVSGGVITKEGEAKLISGLKLAKMTGVSMEKVLELLPTYYNLLHSQFPETTLKEVEKYIRKNWNKI